MKSVSLMLEREDFPYTKADKIILSIILFYYTTMQMVFIKPNFNFRWYILHIGLKLFEKASERASYVLYMQHLPSVKSNLVLVIEHFPSFCQLFYCENLTLTIINLLGLESTSPLRQIL